MIVHRGTTNANTPDAKVGFPGLPFFFAVPVLLPLRTQLDEVPSFTIIRG
jgi:hypothetical protein